MNIKLIVWMSCFLSSVMSFSFQNIQSNSINRSVRLGQFIDIEREVVIDAGSRVDSFAKIAAYTHIGENSRVGSYSTVGEGCDIANNVNIRTYVKIANQVVIGSDSILSGFNAVGNGAKFGNRVKLNEYSSVGNNADIADDCILDNFSTVANSAQLSPKAYIGQYSTVQPYVIVGESAVIHKFVIIESNANVKPRQVIIRTPSSYELYQNCEPNVPAEKANIADRRTNGIISPEFNSMLRQMIDTEFNTLRTNCAQAFGQMRPTTLPEIISLYLIQYDGLQRFNEIERQLGGWSGAQSIHIMNGNVFINGNSVPNSLLWQLQNEFHFGNNSPKNILEPDVRQKLIQLLAIDQDAQRHERVVNDNFCKMLNEILSGERDVTCANPNANGQSQTIITN